jgi:glycosyltransferase involved in cell wall biosynthesis
MRVVHIASLYGSDVSKGGVARAASLLARGQARIGADVSVFASSADVAGDLETREGEDHRGVSFHSFPIRRGSRLSFSRAFLEACNERMGEFDIIHVHGIWSFTGTWAALAARRNNVAYVVSPQGMLNDWAMRFRAYKKIPYWYAVERHTVKGAAWIHFATDEEKRQARRWIGETKSKVIPIGVDLREFAALPPRGEFRDRHRIPRDAPVLAFLGRIHPIKGLSVLLKALARLKAEVPGLILAVAGPDEDGYRSELERLGRGLGIDGHLRWLGTIEEKSKLGFLSDADVFVLPSFSENFGLAAVEAMAVGCPVIVGRGVNIAPQVQAYGAGWVVSTEAEPLASAIAEALHNPEACRTAGKAGQQLVADQYDGEAVAREMLKAYEEHLS